MIVHRGELKPGRYAIVADSNEAYNALCGGLLTIYSNGVLVFQKFHYGSIEPSLELIKFTVEQNVGDEIYEVRYDRELLKERDIKFKLVESIFS